MAIHFNLIHTIGAETHHIKWENGTNDTTDPTFRLSIVQIFANSTIQSFQTRWIFVRHE